MRFKAINNTFHITFNHMNNVFTLSVPEKYVSTIRPWYDKFTVGSIKINTFHWKWNKVTNLCLSMYRGRKNGSRARNLTTFVIWNEGEFFSIVLWTPNWNCDWIWLLTYLFDYCNVPDNVYHTLAFLHCLLFWTSKYPHRWRNQ